MRAAWTVLARSDFEGVKVQLVMREAGTSARAFYRHFADKDGLVLALLRDEMARAARQLRVALAEVDDPVAKVEAWVRNVISAADDPRRVARARLFSAQQAVMRRFPIEVAEGEVLLMETLRDAIDEGARAGSFPWADPDRDARLIYALAGGQMIAALMERPDRNVEEVTSATIAFALQALGVAPS